MKKAAGFYLTVSVIILSIASMVLYIINCRTDYFARQGGIDIKVVLCLGIAIVIAFAYILDANNKNKLFWIPILNGVVLMAAFMLLVNLRAYSMATIMSFEKSEENMSALMSAVESMGCCFGAIILNIIAAFFKVMKVVPKDNAE